MEASMKVEFYNVNWQSLHEDILVQILSYLSARERISLWGVCKHWKKCLLAQSLWKKVTFEISKKDSPNQPQEDKKYLKFFTTTTITTQLVREATLKINYDIEDAIFSWKGILEGLAKNPNLEVFSMKTERPYFCFMPKQDNQPIQMFLSKILRTIARSNNLRAISLGYIRGFAPEMDKLLSLLQEKHGHVLESLHIATVDVFIGCDPRVTADLTVDHFKNFRNLRHLSLEYKYLSEEILYALADPKNAKLLQLNVCAQIGDKTHLHSYISDEAWSKLSYHSPDLKVSITLLDFETDHDVETDIIQPSIPLHTYRSFFRGAVTTYLETPYDTLVLDMANTFTHTLTTVHVQLHYNLNKVYNSALDTFEDIEVMPGYMYKRFPDVKNAFVLLVLNCVNLEEFTLIGYGLFMDEVIEMANARRSMLKTFAINEGAIFFRCGHYKPDLELTTPCYCISEVSSLLGRPWQLTNENDTADCLHCKESYRAIYDPHVLYHHFLMNDVII